MSKTENTFNPSRCIFHVGISACQHKKHPNHNKGKCTCSKEVCPLVIELLLKVETKAPAAKELTDEIKSFRQKNHEFQATKDHETYLIVSFSCKEDKRLFLKNSGLEGEHTLIDGYELAKNLKVSPTKPAFKLREPLSA